MMKLVYQAIFTPNVEGGYVVEFPDLEGCMTEGADMAEAMSMAEDAAGGWILGELEEGKKVPLALMIHNEHLESGQFVRPVTLDMDSYTAKYGKKTF